MAKKKESLTPEQRLQEALVPSTEWPYKLPENWCWTKLGNIANFERGITFPASAKEYRQTDSNIPCLRTANVQETLKIDDLIYVDKSFMKENSKKLVCAEDIIMSSANSRELVGKTSFVECIPFPMTFGGFVLNIRANNISSRLLFYYLRLEFLSGKFIGESTQTTNIANINTTTLGNYSFPLPPLPEQQRIVDRIESLFAQLDEAKEKAQTALDSFETRKAAILHKAFTGELTEKWRCANNVELDTWNLVKAENVCEKIVCGKTPKEFISSVGDIPYLKVYNIVNNEVDFANAPQFIPKSIHESKLKSSVLKPYDIIMNIVGPPLRKIAIIPDTYPEWNMNQAIVRFRPKENLYYRFLYYELINPETLDDVVATTKGVVGQANISITQSRNLQFMLPTMPEQKEIVRILDSLLAKEQQAKEAAEAVLEQIDLTKKSILSRAFRGELGTNDTNEESSIELLKEILT